MSGKLIPQSITFTYDLDDYFDNIKYKSRTKRIKLMSLEGMPLIYTLPNEFADANECPACVGMGYWLKFDNDNGEIKETKETCDRCLGNGLYRQEMRDGTDDDNK